MASIRASFVFMYIAINKREDHMALVAKSLKDIGQGEGITENFKILYENDIQSLLHDPKDPAVPPDEEANKRQQVITNANALMDVVEEEFAATTRWFNTPHDKFGTSHRQVVNLNQSVDSGAGNHGYGRDINLDAFGDSDHPQENIKMVFMAEWVEILMSLTGGRWSAGDSSGEALSQYCAMERFRQGHITYYPSFVEKWLNDGGQAYASEGTIATKPGDKNTPGYITSPNAKRSDWVSKTFKGADTPKNGTINGDADQVSFGCALAFLYYLNVQLGYSITEIIAAYQGTLAQTYANLTGFDQFKVFDNFLARLESVYPAKLRANISGPNWNNPFPIWAVQFGIALPGSVRAGSPLVPLLRMPGLEEIFWIGANGDVSCNWRSDNADNGRWHDQAGLALPGSVRADSPLILFSRNPKQEEIFWIGANGDVSSNYRADGVDGGRWQHQFGIALPGSVRAGSPLVPLLRMPGLEEIFWIGANGDVSCNWRSDNADNGRWHDQAGLALPGSVRADSPLILFSRNPKQEEIFWIGANGDVSSNYRADGVDGGRWQHQFGIALPGSVRAGSPLVPLLRMPGLEEIFWIGANGDVSCNWRADGADNGRWHDQAGLTPPGSVRADSPLIVFSRSPQRVDVFWIGVNGSIYNIWRDDDINRGVWQSAKAISLVGTARKGSPIIVFARARSLLEIFWHGEDGGVSSTYIG